MEIPPQSTVTISAEQDQTTTTLTVGVGGTNTDFLRLRWGLIVMRVITEHVFHLLRFVMEYWTVPEERMRGIVLSSFTATPGVLITLVIMALF